jgi:uncharacterized protein
VVLLDTGPIVAIINRADQYHDRCQAVLPSLSLPFLTTIPVIAETMHLLGDYGGWRLQSIVWQMHRQGALEIAPMVPDDFVRIEELMAKYEDSPMDFADASLVALAEARGERQIFTLDRHFRAYRLPDRRVFHMVPEDV